MTVKSATSSKLAMSLYRNVDSWSQPRVIQYKAASGHATTLSVTLDAAPTAGNRLILFGGGTTTFPNVPSGFSTTVGNYVPNGSIVVWDRVVQSGDSATITIDPNGDYASDLIAVEVSPCSSITLGSPAYVSQAGRTAYTLNMTETILSALYMCQFSGMATQPTGFTLSNGFSVLTSTTDSQNPYYTTTVVGFRPWNGLPVSSTQLQWTNACTSTIALAIGLSKT
jgi:hypothetical protein